ncbi:hypothetical protein BH18ACT4_BH18ACT4_02900 [soil metagenome]
MAAGRSKLQGNPLTGEIHQALGPEPPPGDDAANPDSFDQDRS